MIVIVLLSFLFLPQGVAGQSSDPLETLWDKRMTGVHSVAISQNSECAVVATPERISLLNRLGGEIWHWDFKKGNRFMVASTVAVSPDCKWMGVAGRENYRYTWIAHRDGRLIPLRTQATPVSIAINHHGDMIAIGTGGGDVLLFDSNGTLRWQETLTYCCVQGLSFSADDQAIVSTGRGIGVVSIDGRTKWLNHVALSGIRGSKDLKNYVGWYEPNHGTGICWIQFLDSSGKTLWRKNVPFSPPPIISSAGDLVVAHVKENQETTEAAGQCDSESPSPLRLLSRSGEVLKTFSSMATPLIFGPDGKGFLVRAENFEAWDLSGLVLWTIPAFSKYSRMTASEDQRSIIEWSEDRIAWFVPPK